MEQKIKMINEVLKLYFEQNSQAGKIPAKDFMPLFIKKGIFNQDHRNGLPIRNLLRTLDKAGDLHRIPYVLAERKGKNTNWYFANAKGAKVVGVKQERENVNVVVKKKSTSTGGRKDSDEFYIIDLCDKILGLTGERQKKFDFLLGDANAQGRKAKLPIDVYYESLNLAIEFNEQQHTKAVKHFDKPNVMTVSGVHRGEQRRIYDERKKELLPKNGIQLIHISYDMFECTRNGKLIRNKKKDEEVVKELLNIIK
jgi:hypothetical protein